MTRRLAHPLLGLASGAVFGGLVVSGWFTTPLVLAEVFRGDPERALETLRIWAPLVMVVATIIFAFGLVLFGAPAWVALHSGGRTSPKHALLLGLGTCFAAGLCLSLMPAGGMLTLIEDGRAIILDGRRTFYGWFIALKDAVLLANLGGMVALVVWRVAYRNAPKRSPITPPPARPS